MAGLFTRLVSDEQSQQADRDHAAKAVPSAVDRLLAVPRSAPTSPASSLGEAVTQHVEHQRQQRAFAQAER